MWWVGEKNLPVGDGFAIAQLMLLQNESNNTTMAACSSSCLHFQKSNSYKMDRPYGMSGGG
jgi:hypothetical protein